MRISDWSSDVCPSDLQSRHGLTSDPRCGHGRAMLKLIARIVLIFVDGSVLWVMAYRFINPPTTMTMIGAWMYGRKIHREWLPLPEIDRDMARAAIAAEDSRFCSHWGFDLEAIGKADRKSTRLNSSHSCATRMPSSA